MAKAKLAMYWASGCGGCDISLLEIHERLLDVLESFDLVFWPCVMDTSYADVEAMDDGAIDVCLVNGSIRSEENRRIVELLRRKSKALVAFGACAAWGGVPGLANLYPVQDMIDRAFSTESTDNPEGVRPRSGTAVDGETLELTTLDEAVRPIAQVVQVDYVIPGCPPEADRVWDVCAALVAGEAPAPPATIGAGAKAVCDECPLTKNETKVTRFHRPHEIIADGVTCLLEQGVVCVGPATRSGCGAKCPSAGMPCRGCYGAAGDAIDQGAKMIAALGSVIACSDEDSILEAVGGVVDPAGTFYRFGLPASILGRARGAR